jgi:hypothetical protein
LPIAGEEVLDRPLPLRVIAHSTPKTALAKVRDWQNEAERKRRIAEAIRDDDRETLWAAFAAYMLETKRRARISGETFKSYRRAMEALLDWTADGRMPHQLTPSDANQYRTFLSESGGRQGQGLSNASVNARLAGTRKFMAAAQDEDGNATEERVTVKRTYHCRGRSGRGRGLT